MSRPLTCEEGGRVTCRAAWKSAQGHRETSFPRAHQCAHKVFVPDREECSSLRNSTREIEKFITGQPPIGEKDDYDSENSWISDGLLSSNSTRFIQEVVLSKDEETSRHKVKTKVSLEPSTPEWQLGAPAVPVFIFLSFR